MRHVQEIEGSELRNTSKGSCHLVLEFELDVRFFAGQKQGTPCSSIYNEYKKEEENAQCAKNWFINYKMFHRCHIDSIPLCLSEINKFLKVSRVLGGALFIRQSNIDQNGKKKDESILRITQRISSL